MPGFESFKVRIAQMRDRVRARVAPAGSFVAKQFARYRNIRGHKFITVTAVVLLATLALNPELFGVVGQQVFRPMSGAVFGLLVQLIFVPYRDDVQVPTNLEKHYDRRALLMGLGSVAFCLIP